VSNVVHSALIPQISPAKHGLTQSPLMQAVCDGHSGSDLQRLSSVRKSSKLEVHNMLMYNDLFLT